MDQGSLKPRRPNRHSRRGAVKVLRDCRFAFVTHSGAQAAALKYIMLESCFPTLNYMNFTICSGEWHPPSSGVAGFLLFERSALRRHSSSELEDEEEEEL